jgi:hypothetical protein
LIAWMCEYQILCIVERLPLIVGLYGIQVTRYIHSH